MTTLDHPHHLGAISVVITIIAALVTGAAPTARADVLQVSANRIGSGAVTDPVPDGCQADDCSLREAVMAANETPELDVISFAEPGVITLTIGEADDERTRSAGDPIPFGQATQDLDSLSPLIIEGLGRDQTVIRSAYRLDGGEQAIGRETRILDSRALLAMSDLTLEDAFVLGDGGLIRAEGATTLSGMTLQRGAAQGRGGALALRDGALSLESTTFRSNRSLGDGGAVSAEDFELVSVTSSVFEDNAAEGASGGALHGSGVDHQARLDIAGSTFLDNSTPPLGDESERNGGAINFVQGRLFIDDSVLRGNGARGTPARVTGTRNGGAIYTTEDTEEVVILDTVFMDNAAEIEGGTMVLAMRFAELRQSLIADSVSGLTGAINVDSGAVLEIVNSTISGATARQTAALDLHPQSTTTMAFSTITSSTILADDRFHGNPPSALIAGDDGTLTMVATIVSDTTGGPNCVGDGITSLGSNLSDDTSCDLLQPSDLVGVDPQVGLLGDNGGHEVGAPQASEINLTRAPDASSPAVDTVDLDGCGAFPFEFDQRGVERPQGLACDRGAHEVGEAPGPSPTPSTSPTPNPTPSPTPSVQPSAEPTQPPSTDVSCDVQVSGGQPLPAGITRLQGPSRIQTAVAASQAVCADGRAPAVVLTRADQFPDAQAGTPLAVSLGAPLLLTQPDALHPDTEAEIRRVLAPGGTVHLLGGEFALSSTITDQLAVAGYQTVRYAGDNRFETAAQIAAAGLDDPDTVLLADGGDFAASIVAGTAAAAINDAEGSDVQPNRSGPDVAAVVLTSGHDIPPETQAYLDQRDGSASVMAIGTAAAGAAPGVPAIAGPTAIDTAVAVAERFFPLPTIVGIARVDEFADGLAGGAVVGRAGVGPGPMLLVPTDELPDAVAAWLTQNADSIRSALIFGGSAAISPAVEAALPFP